MSLPSLGRYVMTLSRYRHAQKYVAVRTEDLQLLGVERPAPDYGVPGMAYRRPYCVIVRGAPVEIESYWSEWPAALERAQQLVDREKAAP